jgi:hypothetical protein
MAMETPHAETFVDKAVTFVKDVLGIQAQPDYHTPRDVLRENATHLEPRAFGTRVGEVDDGSFVKPLGDPEDEHLRRAVGELNQEKTVKLNPESGRVEETKFDAFPTKSVAELNEEIVRRENGM